MHLILINWSFVVKHIWLKILDNRLVIIKFFFGGGVKWILDIAFFQLYFESVTTEIVYWL